MCQVSPDRSFGLCALFGADVVVDDRIYTFSNWTIRTGPAAAGGLDLAEGLRCPVELGQQVSQWFSCARFIPALRISTSTPESLLSSARTC